MMILPHIKTMKTYCVSFKKNTVNKNSCVKRTKESWLMLLSNCVVCGKKKLKFIKNQEASKLLGDLGFKIPIKKFQY